MFLVFLTIFQLILGIWPLEVFPLPFFHSITYIYWCQIHYRFSYLLHGPCFPNSLSVPHHLHFHHGYLWSIEPRITWIHSFRICVQNICMTHSSGPKDASDRSLELNVRVILSDPSTRGKDDDRVGKILWILWSFFAQAVCSIIAFKTLPVKYSSETKILRIWCDIVWDVKMGFWFRLCLRLKAILNSVVKTWCVEEKTT